MLDLISDRAVEAAVLQVKGVLDQYPIASIREARVHFAIVCVFLSRPDLRREPNRRATLGAQLAAAARGFLENPTKGRGRRLHQGRGGPGGGDAGRRSHRRGLHVPRYDCSLRRHGARSPRRSNAPRRREFKGSSSEELTCCSQLEGFAAVQGTAGWAYGRLGARSSHEHEEVQQCIQSGRGS